MTSSRSVGNSVVIVLAVAFLLRCAIVWLQPAPLMTDPDHYVAIARQVSDGNGFVSPETGKPTAYRPPLYPLTLSGVLSLTGFERRVLGIGLWHAVLGMLIAGGTWLAARRLGFRKGAVIAALLVAVDPLLLQYTTIPMTETLCTALVIGLLAMLLSQRAPLNNDEPSSDHPSPEAEDAGLPFEQRWSVWTQLGIGLLFGLAVLCRPTVWMWGLLLVPWFAVRGVRSRGLAGVGHFWPALLAAILTVAPWAIRNQLVFGRPILTTTHGGYTLLLGNNAVFAEEVVTQPWGATWSGDSLRQWQQSLEEKMEAADPPVSGELDRDRWMGRRAREFMLERPATTGQAGWLRLRRLWNPIPLPPATASIHRAAERLTGRLGLAEPEPVVELLANGLRWLIIVFHGGLGIAAVIGMFRLDRSEWSQWMLPLLLLIAFSLVHFFYWSNTRMRAPLMPAVILFAVRGLQIRRRTMRPTEPTATDDATQRAPAESSSEQSPAAAPTQPASSARPTEQTIPTQSPADQQQGGKSEPAPPSPPEIPPAV